ncbi:MAG: hypothetical protein IJV40_07310 [Oscillospiraceae bacterium]|nr:hypothetical protein [Oscillospiraceae bacterium]
MLAEDRAFLDSIKGKVSDGVYELMEAFYSLSQKNQAFMMPYVKQIADGANPNEIIAKAKNDIQQRRMCKTA